MVLYVGCIAMICAFYWDGLRDKNKDSWPLCLANLFMAGAFLYGIYAIACLEENPVIWYFIIPPIGWALGQKAMVHGTRCKED